MASNQAIKYAPECGDLTMESLTIHNNNVVGVFNYPETALAYHEICKYLMNFPLAGAFTKTPSVVYQNLLREFWCTAVATHLNLPTDDSEVRPLKEYTIKFSVMNGKMPLTLEFKTFMESTGVDYAKDTYDTRPENCIPRGLEDSVHIFCLGSRGNYSSTEQVNSIQQLFAYCLLTRLKLDIGEIIYSNLVTRLTNMSRQKYVSYPRFVSCTLEVLLGPDYTQDESFGSSPTILSNSNFSKDPSKVTPIELTAFMVVVNSYENSVNPLPFTAKKKKGKSQTVTPTLPQTHGPEASGALPQKRKKPAFMVVVNNCENLVNPLPFTAKKKKGKSQTVTPTLPQTQGPEASGALPQKRKKPKSKKTPNETKTQWKQTTIDKRLPSTVSDEGAAKTTPSPEGPRGDTDSEGLKPPTDMEPQTNHVADLSGTGAMYQVDETQSTRLRYQSLTRNEGKTSYEVESGTEPLKLQTFAYVQDFLLFEDELVQESDNEEAFAAREDMDEDTQADEEVQSPPPNTDKPESLLVQDTNESTSESSPELKKYDNILPLTERQLVKYLRKASIEGYYEENVDHMDQTDKVIDATMNSLDKNSIARGDILNALNGVIKTLKAIQDVVKEDPVLNKKVIAATKAYTKNLTHLTELLTLIKYFDSQRLKSLVESLQATALSQDKHLADWAKLLTYLAWNLGPRMTAIENS
ncbi:hypothetical protein Tco_0536195 [Tanacetum coccineum]